MRVQINLATRPFVELRPFFLRLRLFMAALVVLGIALAITAHILAAKAARQQAELDQLRDQTIAAQRDKLRTEQRMRLPGNAAVLDRAHFLNTLFLRKSFSWTAVMMDLENVLPAGVQVTSIEPAVTADGAVLIRLRVAGERDRAVELVRNLERSRRFLQPRLGSESAQTREQTAVVAPRPGMAAPVVPEGPPGVEFEIIATYNPLPSGQPYVIPRPRAELTVPPGTPAGQGVAVPEGLAALNREIQQEQAKKNIQNGYPPNGVVLPPYQGRRGPAVVHPAPIPGQPRGGVR